MAPAAIEHDPLRLADDARADFVILGGRRVARDHHVERANVPACRQVRQHRTVRIEEVRVAAGGVLDVDRQSADGDQRGAHGDLQAVAEAREPTRGEQRERRA